jgi:iron(III) transport system substrate-binding protein
MQDTHSHSYTSQLLGGVLLLSLLGTPTLVAGQEAASTPQANKRVYLYQGRDREQYLLENAKREGTVVLYTSMNTKDSEPLVAVFQKKYGIKVSLWRDHNEKVMERALAEARAGKFSVDVIETQGNEMERLSRAHIFERFYSPHFRDIPPQAFSKNGYYVADRINFFVVAYNTKLVKESDVPNTYEDLLDPKWAGKITIEPTDVDWFASVAKAMCEQYGISYFRKLADTKPQMRAGHTEIADLIAKGEIPLAITAYNHSVERLSTKGAPVRWKALSPTFGRPAGIGVAGRAPHPHAAMLLADFVLSREGQQIIKDRNRVPSSTAIDTQLNKFPYEMIDPMVVLDESAKWEKLWSEIFLKGKAIEKGSE